MSLPTPNYVLTEGIKHYSNPWKEAIDVPAGTFVRPIDDRYLPQHIKDSDFYKWYDKEIECWCYCRHGIIRIKKSSIRQT